MAAKRLILSLLLMGLVILLYYQHFSVDKPTPDQNTAQELIDLFSGGTVVDNKAPQDNSPDKSNDTESTERRLIPAPVSNNLKRIEIFGRVVDEYRQPIESVLVSEDRYLFNTRSDLNGQYRLTLELPKHKFPTLNFLRTGYESDRPDISAADLDNVLALELNVTLIESTESIKISGWIGNEIGENLAGQEVSIFSQGHPALGNIDQTVVSDGNGEFVFEAVIPDLEYQLEVYTSPQYAPYSIQELILTRTTPRLIITLKTLKFLQVSGMFVDMDGVPVPNFEIDIINLSTGIHVRRIVTDSSGFFSLENFPAGEIRFSSRAPEHFKITGLTLAENQYKHLMLIVDKGSYQITGWVSDKNGVAVDRAMVMLDAEVLSEGIRSESNRSTVTDTTGFFRFDQLADTPHQITVYARDFYAKELQHRFQSLASEIHISLTRE